MGKRRTLPAALTGLLTLALVGGCTSDSPDGDGPSSTTTNGSRTTISMTEVDGAKALRPNSDRIGSWDTVVQGKRGTVITEITGSDGKPAQLFAVDPKSSDRTALDVTAPLGWSTAVNDSVAVIAGDRTDDASATPFVRVSSDLRTWQDVEVSYPKAGWRYAGVGLDGDVPLLVAEKPDGSTALMRIDENETSVHELPAADGQEIDVVDLVEHDGRLVLLYSEAARGDESVSRVMTSADGGRTWERQKALPGKRGTYGVAGAVSTGKQLVVTGWADRDGMQGSTGVVWTSSNARTWKRQRVTPLSHSATVLIPGPDFHATAPSLVNGKALFDQTCDTCTWTTRVVYTGGLPMLNRSETRIDGVEPAVDQLPGGVASGVRWEQGSLIAFSPEGSHTLVEGERGRVLQSIERVGSSAYVSLGQGVFVRDGESWHTTTEVTPFVLGSDLTQQEWQPKVLGQWSDLSAATDPKGRTTVTTGTTFSEKQGFRAVSRSLTDGTWSKATGLNRHPYESTGDVTYADGHFLLDLVVAQNGSTAARTARVYSSQNGRGWTEEEGTWEQAEGAGSRLHEICELPDGTAFAVGTSRADRNARWEATTWTRGRTGWELDVPKVTGKGARFSSCATTGEVSVVTGSLGGDDMEWTTTDGTEFTPGKALPRGVSRGTAHEVEGGLVASGYIDTAEHLGPVIWYSTDGTTWQWAPVDVDDASASVWVDTVGDTVYAVTSQSSGDRLWTIDEIATTKLTGDEV